MFDARRFNVRDASGFLLCPACGFPGYARHPAYNEVRGLIGICCCPCCLWEPGFDDDARASAAAQTTIIASLRAYRARWCDEMPWRGKASARPANWDGQAQLARLFELAPHVR